jgi:putative Holliday junction resolvase
LAVSDPTRFLASTAGWIDRRGPRQDLDAIRESVRRHGAVLLVVGLPLSLSGATGPQAQSTLVFVEALRASLEIPIETWDERYTSVEAESILRAQGKRRNQPRGRVDEVAAASILQEYLDAHQGAGQA